MRILLFGSYDPAYPRNRMLIKGLRENGMDVVELNERGGGILKFFRLAYRHRRSRYDVMLVPFPGQEVMLLARLLTRKRIVFDAFTSHYGGYILDRAKYGPRSIPAYWYFMLDTISCRLADTVLLDTQAHIDFFVKTFKLPRDKFHRLYVGTDTDVMQPRLPKEKNGTFTVHFHGNYIPLQGVEYIIKAADILRNEGIVFNLIGRGQTFLHDAHLAESLRLGNVRFIDRVPYAELAERMNAADVCLGIFGHTPKTPLVIPNKVFEALACARPVITARTKAIDELLQDRESALLCRPADPNDLAEKILLLKNDPELAGRIARGGYEVFKTHATVQVIGRELASLLQP